HRDIGVDERGHALLALQCLFDEGRQRLRFAAVAFGALGSELVEYRAPQQVERLADMRVLIAPGLLQQDDLVDAGGFEGAYVLAKFGRCADAARALKGTGQALRAGYRGRQRSAAALRLELVEQPRPARHRVL